MKPYHYLLLFFLSTNLYSQSIIYSTATIPQELMNNANAIVRFNEKTIDISSRKLMTVSVKKAVTILNEKGLRHMDAGEYFSNSSKIKSIEATILNKGGAEIKKIKRRDFKENSVSEGSIITDNKLLFLDYTPVAYPFTLLYESVVETSNTAFIPSWYPLESTYVGVESASIAISYLPELGFKYKSFNFDDDPQIIKEVTGSKITYTAKNLPAIKYEEYSPSYQNFFPYVMFGLTSFNLEGVEGVASDWENFGSWMYESLLKNTDEIPEETQAKVKLLIGDEKDPLKIAKIVYKYVQDKTRYISIQLGIGGWKPMLAKDVDRLGYGDCKALSNYTRSLLQTVGIPAYYTVIYGGSEPRSLQQDFVSMQGNHVVLAVPIDDKLYWLECTSQMNPFGFQGDFTDNRWALMITPKGGEMVKTPKAPAQENSQITEGAFTVDTQGGITGSLVIKSRGIQYDYKYLNENKSPDDLNKFYKSYFWNINNLKLQKIDLINDKEKIAFVENITLEAPNYATVNSGRMMFSLNAFNNMKGVPLRYRTRNNPFEIDREFYDYDEVIINLPTGFTVEAKPDNAEIKDKFGFYKTEYNIVEENKLLYKRTYQINAGYFDKNEYESFRKFKENIAKIDNAKIVLIKKQ